MDAHRNDYVNSFGENHKKLKPVDTLNERFLSNYFAKLGFEVPFEEGTSFTIPGNETWHKAFRFASPQHRFEIPLS